MQADPCVNELLNGSYELGDFGSSITPDDWTFSSWQPSAIFTWDLDISHTGATSVKVSDAVANDAAWIQTITLTPNTKYLLSGWVKTDSVSGTGAGANLCLWGTFTRSAGLHGTNGWTYVTLFFDSGATGVVTIGARLGFWAGTSSGTAWFDDLKVTQLEPPSPAPDPTWEILVLIYGETDFFFTDAGSLTHHVVASMTAQEKADAAAQATAFVQNDIPLLNSGNMSPNITIRYPAAPLSQLTTIDVEKWWPAPNDVAADLDPAFDSVIVVWDPRGDDLTTGLPRNLNKFAGLTAGTGTGQAYTTIYIQGAMNLAHRNIYKHEWGHSIIIFYDAIGATPLPIITPDAFPAAGPWVHWPTGDAYVWVDETLASPIPNSIYHNTSGFTHDYYSGETATPDQPTRALGIPPTAWALGGPVVINSPPSVTSITRANVNPTKASSVNFTVTFSKSVNCVGVSDFTTDSSGLTGSSITSVTGSGFTYTVTVNTGTGEGTLSIDLSDDDTIVDSVGNLLGGPGSNNGNYTAGEAYTIDRTPPAVSIGAPSTVATNTGPVTFGITYTDADSVNLTTGDITLNKTGTANAIVNVIGGTISTPTVSLSAITGNGVMSISIDSATSSDSAGNDDLGAGPSATFVVDNTAPTVTVDPLTTSDSSPPLTGTVDDGTAVISVSVNGQVNLASNNGSTWTLTDGLLNILPAGTYGVAVTATDWVGNIGVDSTFAELTIESAGPGTDGIITINLLLDQIFPGDRLEFTAPAGGTDYVWKKNGVAMVESPPRVVGTASQVLVINPVVAGDAGSYTVAYEDNVTRNIVETDPLIIVVQDLPSLPLAGQWTLALLGGILLALALILLKQHAFRVGEK